MECVRWCQTKISVTVDFFRKSYATVNQNTVALTCVGLAIERRGVVELLRRRVATAIVSVTGQIPVRCAPRVATARILRRPPQYVIHAHAIVVLAALARRRADLIERHDDGQVPHAAVLRLDVGRVRVRARAVSGRAIGCHTADVRRLGRTGAHETHAAAVHVQIVERVRVVLVIALVRVAVVGQCDRVAGGHSWNDE